MPTTESRIKLVVITVVMIAAITAAKAPVSRAASSRLVETRARVSAPDSVTVGERFGVTHTFSFPDTLEMLVRYDWPNNVCELRMEIERAITLTKDHELIEPVALSEHLVQSMTRTRSLG